MRAIRHNPMRPLRRRHLTKASNFGDFSMVIAPPVEIGYSEFVHQVAESKVANVHISQSKRELYVDMVEGGPREHVLFAGTPTPIVEMLNDKGVPYEFYEDWTANAPLYAIELAVIIVLVRAILNGANANGIAGKFGASPAKELKEEEHTGVTFDDIAGADNAKQDLMEIVDFLKAPDRYERVGAKIPRGVLLVGPPGTGKTLLARAVAGEANVPFFPCSGSEFIEMFVGVGASRVRQLFAKAVEKSPSIIFIDEIDAIGKQRGSNPLSGGGGNDERDQTINQLLTAMDGFKGNTGVIVIAATNRPDILDDALLRPGRFDRRVSVDLPDLTGRLGILKIHARGKPLASDVSLESLGKVTVGFSGADLESLCNEAAIYAARAHRDVITADDFEKSLEKLTMGEERRTLLVTDEKKRLIAYHEAGHALLGLAFQDHGFDKLRKISIVPRGSAGGATYFEPDENHVDLSLVTRQYLEQQIMVTLGGRIAEEIVFGEQKVTTGASGDFQMVHELAYSMITEYGFSDLGPMYLGDSSGMDQEINQEVLILVNELYVKAHDIVQSNRALLDDIALALLTKETLIAEDLEMFKGKVVEPKSEN